MLWGVFRSLFNHRPPSIATSAHPNRWDDDSQEHYDVTTDFKIVTFNMLAPCYKRLYSPDQEKSKGIDLLRRSSFRESSKDFIWQARARDSLAFFNAELFEADVIALQEFWLEEEYASLFYKEIERNGFYVHTLKRSDAKSDAVAILVRKQNFEIVKIKHVILSRFGDRVALVLWLKYFYHNSDREKYVNLVVANTHLSFPHNEFIRDSQLEQMKTLTGNLTFTLFF